MKITKKQIAIEYDCMMSVKGPYPEGDNEIKSAITKAKEPYTEACTFADGSVKNMLNNGAQSREDIIDRAYSLAMASDIRNLRRAIGLTTSDFGALVGVSGRSVEDWEQGRRSPSGPARKILAQLAKDRRSVRIEKYGNDAQ